MHPPLLLSLFSAEVKDNSRSHKKALLPVPQRILMLYPTRARATHFTSSTRRQYHHGVGGWLGTTAKARTWSKCQTKKSVLCPGVRMAKVRQPHWGLHGREPASC